MKNEDTWVIILLGAAIGIPIAIGTFCGLSILATAALFVLSFFILCGIVMLYLFINAPKERAKKELQNKKDFYRKCVSERIAYPLAGQGLQKAELIAKSLDCKYTDIDAYYREGRELCEAEDAQAREERLRKLRDAEREEERKLSAYSGYYGREKRVAMLRDLVAQSKENADVLRKYAGVVVGSTQQKESDWAIMGGLASELAGGAAGLATAADIQARNAQVRTENAANLARVAPAVGYIADQSASYSRSAASYAQQLQDAQTKLVSDKPGDRVMEKLRFEGAKVNISETGTFKVDVNVELCGALDGEFEGRPAVIDGAIAATLYQDQRAVGSARLVLPLYGISGKCSLKGMCCGSAAPGKPYELKFKPDRLWIMER